MFEAAYAAISISRVGYRMLARTAYTIFPPVVMVVRADLSRIEGGKRVTTQGRCGTTVLRKAEGELLLETDSRGV